MKKVSVNGLNSQVDSVKEPISEPYNYSNTLKAWGADREKEKKKKLSNVQNRVIWSVFIWKKKSPKKRKQLIEEREEIFERLMTENFPEKRERYKTFY